MESWTEYFKVVGIKPGPVVTHRFGPVDFSDPSLPVEKMQSLYEANSPYLHLTDKGKEILYGIKGADTKPTPTLKPAPIAAARPESETASEPGHGAAYNENNHDKQQEPPADDDAAGKAERRRGKKRRATFFDPIEHGPEDYT